MIADQPGGPPLVVNGQQLALKYYVRFSLCLCDEGENDLSCKLFQRAGLALDPKHPHLYTNLGSLLKDMGQLAQAVQMYRMAVEYNPTFVSPCPPLRVVTGPDFLFPDSKDVALANLANAIKDTGHIVRPILSVHCFFVF